MDEMNRGSSSGVRLYESMEQLNEIRKRMNVGGVFLIIGFLLCMFGPVSAHLLPMVAGFVMVLMGAYISKGQKKEFNKIYKAIFVEQPLRKHFNNVYFNWEQGFPESRVRDFGICAMGNRFQSEDYLKAEYDGVTFEMSDVSVKQHTSSGKSSHTTIYFQGRMMAFEFPDKFVTSVQIFSDNFVYRGRPMGLKPTKVQMESEEFNKKYDVLSLSPHDAFYILTPQLMEKIDYFASKYRRVGIHITGNKVYVGFHDLNMSTFDSTSGMASISYPDEMEKIERDIDDIKSIITTLKSIGIAGSNQPSYEQQQNKAIAYNSNDYYISYN